MDDRYKCTPLIGEQFRLLRLEPGKWDDPIEFDLASYSLDGPGFPFYEALSYTWGQRDDTVTVMYRGERVTLGRNGIRRVASPAFL